MRRVTVADPWPVTGADEFATVARHTVAASVRSENVNKNICQIVDEEYLFSTPQQMMVTPVGYSFRLSSDRDYS